MVQRLWSALRDWAARVALAMLVGLLFWFIAPWWRYWNATGLEIESTATQLKVTNARTASLEALRVLVVGTIASRLAARIEGEAMAEVPQDDPLAHKFQKLLDGSEATLGRGSTLELAALSSFDFRHDVRTLVLIAKDGFSTNIDALEAVRPLKLLLSLAAATIALCLLAPRARRRLWPTTIEKALALAEGTAAQAALENLTRAEREILELRFRQGLAVAEMAELQGHEAGGRHLTDADVDSLRDGRSLSEGASQHLDACVPCQHIIESLRTFDPDEGVERMLARVPAWAQGPRPGNWRLAVGGLAMAVAVGALGWSAVLRVRSGEQALALVQEEASTSEATVSGLRARNEALVSTMKAVRAQLSGARARPAAEMDEAIEQALDALDGALKVSSNERQPVIKVSAAPGDHVRITTGRSSPSSETLPTEKSGPFVASLVAKAPRGKTNVVSFAPGVGDRLICEFVASARKAPPRQSESLMMAFTGSPGPTEIGEDASGSAPQGMP